MDIKIKTLIGQDIAPYIPTLAKLRIIVFREYPYLYDGDLAYEENYLKRYSDCPQALIALACDGNNPIGMSSCLPMSEEKEFKEPFIHEGIAVEDVFYFGESILLPKYRGHGIGKRFFELREDHAKKTLGKKLKYTAFCAVNREGPIPESYHSPEPLWLKNNYKKMPNMMATFHWKDLGDNEETPKTLTFWLKEHS